MTTTSRLVLRATTDDLANVALVAEGLRRSGVPFPTRADAMQFALKLAADSARAAA